jgi:hypothetical protein
MRDYPCLELVSTPIYRVEVLKGHGFRGCGKTLGAGALKGHGFSRAVNLRKRSKARLKAAPLKAPVAEA